MNIIELIERSANELRDNECWTLDRIPHSSGYVYVKNKRLHRVAWEAHNAEPIPEDMVVMHTCDNRQCFNPNHLTLGTQQENIFDAVAKKRWTRKSRGKKMMSEAKVPAIQHLLDLEVPKQLIADLFGIHLATIYRRFE